MSNNCVENVTCDDWTSTTVSSSLVQDSHGLSKVIILESSGGGGSAWVWDTGSPAFAWLVAKLASISTKVPWQGLGVKTIGSGGGYGGFYCFALNPELKLQERFKRNRFIYAKNEIIPKKKLYYQSQSD